IGIKEIFIPPNPGLFSAYGLLTVDVIRPFSKSGIGLTINEIKEKLDALEKDAKESLRKEGFLNVEAERYLDMHYVGQSYEITIPISGDIDPFELFKNEHSKLYGYSSDDPIEIVNMRVIGKAEIPKIEMKEYKGNGPVREVSRRKVYFNGEFIETPVYIREEIPPGAEGKGPTIIESYDSTIVVNPKWSWRVDKYLNINLRRD
ncbi:MAG: hypothetical protein QXT40_03460, partial [Candidatus Micrarchaeia archaeon]